MRSQLLPTLTTLFRQCLNAIDRPELLLRAKFTGLLPQIVFDANKLHSFVANLARLAISKIEQVAEQS